MQQPETFRGPALQPLLATIRKAHGSDAILVSMRNPSETDGSNYEIVVAPPEWDFAPAFGITSAAESDDRAHLELVETAQPTAAPTTQRKAGERKRHTIVLVGPPGSGKTTTAVKLALHGLAYGDRTVGLLTLDTFRAGAIEQLQVFADIAGLPLEVAYDAADVERALESLAHCDVMIVDTPGRGLRDRCDLEWQACLAALHADEVDLVIPAGLRLDVALEIRDASVRFRPTHAILTMVDQLPADASIGPMRDALALPIKWITDGPSVPADLRPPMFPPQGALARAG